MDENEEALKQESVCLEPTTADVPVESGETTEAMGEATTEKTVVVRPGDASTVVPSFGRSPSDDYAICGKIGGGGMGIVYLARDRRLGRYVAIKRLNEKALADPVLRTRFLHEARAVATLNHAYIVHIYALGEDALGPYIVMEYVSGPAQTEVVKQEGADAPPPKNLTLEEYINNHGSMTADEAVSMISKVARTMVYAHSCGVIHRDLKPSNILLDPSYEPKLVDFGLARITPQDGAPRVEELTVPGEKLISLGYSAPELEQDASTSDGRADIYSLGAILYFLLTGRNPRYYREQDVPAFLREVLRRSLETVREQRYRTAQDFVRALSEAASHGKTVAPTIKTTWRCKWCDAVNPISTKFCAECGWDGSERCLECGAETFVGQQYCPSCGADCRMYEHVASIVKLMNQAKEERRFERIATIAGRLHGFEPSGPTGRQILADARKCVEDAERCVARRNRLAALIPNELKAENYERAQTFIEEFRLINEDPMVYEEELRNLPAQILARDLVRVRQALRTRDWETAQLLLGNMSIKYGNMPEYQDVKSRFLAHERKCKRIRWAASVAGVVLLYMLSLPLTARLLGGELGSVGRVLYTPAKVLAMVPGVHAAMDAYVANFNQPNGLQAYFMSAEELAEYAERAKEERQTPRVPLPDGAEQLCSTFEFDLDELEMRQTGQALNLLERYRQELSDLREKAKVAGDYEGVMAAKEALEEYDETNSLSPVKPTDPEKLANQKERFANTQTEQKLFFAKKYVSTSKRYIASLDELRKGYTQRDEMEKARIISDEITRVKQLPLIADAEAVLASQADAEGRVALMVGTDDTHEVTAEELGIAEKYAALMKQVEALDAIAAQALADFPKQYTARLTTMMEQFQQSGDYNGLETTSEELFRYEEEGTLTANHIVEHPRTLKEAQHAFLKQYQEIVTKRDVAKLTAFQTYISDLETLKSDLTKRNQLETASIVNQALRMVRKDPQYTALTGQRRTPTATPKAPVKVVPTASTIKE